MGISILSMARDMLCPAKNAVPFAVNELFFLSSCTQVYLLFSVSVKLFVDEDVTKYVRASDMTKMARGIAKIALPITTSIKKVSSSFPYVPLPGTGFLSQ